MGEKKSNTPSVKSSLKKRPPEKSAVGMKAVVSALGHVRREMEWDTAFKALNQMNQKGGFDCPGCAWPDPSSRSRLGEYCENGVKAIAEEATYKKANADFFASHPVSELASWLDFHIGKSGRLTEPMILEEGEDYYQPISWDKAFHRIANKLKALESPDEAIFYTSGRTSNEAAFLYQLFVRMYGTNNLPDCSNMCHESSGVALSQTLGIGKGSVKLEDFALADLVIVIGQNPGTNHPRMLSALQQTKRNGGKILAINPLKETGLLNFKHPQKPVDWVSGGTSLADRYLQLMINSDVPLLKAIMKLMLEKEEQDPGSVFDHEFISANTSGYEEFISSVKKEDLDRLIRLTGLKKREIEAASQLIMGSENIIVCWAMGLTQHENAVDNVREIVNLLLLKGSIGKPGAGTCPVRGHSNVQGDRTMGIWETPSKAFLDSLERNFGFPVPRKHGYNTVEAIQAMNSGKAKVFFAMGGNFLSATPDTEYTFEAMRNCELTVHVSTKLNRSHLVGGKESIILPCLGRSEKDVQETGEQFVSVENSMGVVHASKGALTPVSNQLLSEPKIIAELARSTLEGSKFDWGNITSNYDQIRDLIEKTIPGFKDYNRRVRGEEGFYLPNGVRENTFKTENSKAHFTINKLPSYELAPGQFLMMTIRSHDQFNTTIYGLNDRYRGIFNERRLVLMNQLDMREVDLVENELVDLISHYGKERVAKDFLVVSYDIPQKCVATYFPEANVLVPVDYKAHTSNTPASKSIIIRIKKHLSDS